MRDKSAICLAAFLVGCGDIPSRDIAQSAVVSRIDGGSSSRVKLADFAKLNGQAAEVFGVKVYSMAFSAIAEFTDDALYAVGGSVMEPEVRIKTLPVNTTVRSCAQDLTACFSQTPMVAARGDRIPLRGEVRFEKTERGWQVGALRLSLVDAAALPNRSVTSVRQSGKPAALAPSALQKQETVDPMKAMETALRSVLYAQEEYMGKNGKWLSSETIAKEITLPSGVSAPAIVLPAAGGWTATVTHRSRPGVVCASAVMATNPVNPSAGEGAVACK